MERDYTLEYNRCSSNRGSIEVIVGSMFSGKTEELLRRVRRTLFANLKVQVFKPALDTRYSEENVVSHDKTSVIATPVNVPDEIRTLSQGVQVVAIDEAQFFDESIVTVCQELADAGIRVIVSGLDLDFQRHPFGSMPALMAIADIVTKVHAVCVSCGTPAQYSFRLAKGEDQILLGEKEEYEPLCRCCYLLKSQK